MKRVNFQLLLHVCVIPVCSKISKQMHCCMIHCNCTSNSIINKNWQQKPCLQLRKLKVLYLSFSSKKSLKVDISWHYPVIPIPVFLSFVIKCVFIATIAVICSADLQQESEASISASTRAEQWIIVTIIYLFYHFIRFSLNRKLFLCT